MNRGRSSDSLDNGMNDIISSGSSSPTDFSSDDELAACNRLYMISGQTMNKKPGFSGSKNEKVDNYLSQFANNSGHLETAMQKAAVLGSSSSQNQQSVDNAIDHSSVASTSYMDMRQPNRPMLEPSRIPNIVPDSSTFSLLPDQIYKQHNQLYRTPHSSQRLPSAVTGINLNDNSENLADDEDDYGLFNDSRPHAPEHPIPAIAGPNEAMNSLTIRLCAKLVECRTLVEAMEFVAFNRDIIDNLTRIVTRDAPAFRNYDMSNYKIDYSVRDSFNPNFWLDREPVITTADGNCQYHAVSISLTGSEVYTPEVRLATAVAVVDNHSWFDSVLKLIDRGTVLDLVHEIARCHSWGDETTLKAIAVAIRRRIFLYTCNIGKKDYEMVKSLTKEELLDAFKKKKYRGGTGIHAYADPLTHVPANNYIMLFHKSEHFIAVLPTSQQPTMYEPYNPIVPTFS